MDLIVTVFLVILLNGVGMVLALAVVEGRYTIEMRYIKHTTKCCSALFGPHEGPRSFGARVARWD
jgi:hypothetical protein